MADKPKRTGPPEATDPDLAPVRGPAGRAPRRFDLEEEKTVNATDEELAQVRALQNRAAEEARGPDVTVPRAEAAKAPETLLGDASSPNLGPGSTFDNLSEEISLPPKGGAKPSATALFGDDEDEDATQAVSMETPTPAPAPTAKPKTGSAPAHLPRKRVDVQSGQNRAHKPKVKPQPMDADAFEPVAGGSLELSSTTNRDLELSHGLLSRIAQESWPVKLSLAAAILTLTGFVLWLVFLAAR